MNPFKTTLKVELECRNPDGAASEGEQVDEGCAGCPSLKITTTNMTTGKVVDQEALVDRLRGVHAQGEIARRVQIDVCARERELAIADLQQLRTVQRVDPQILVRTLHDA